MDRKISIFLIALIIITTGCEKEVILPDAANTSLEGLTIKRKVSEDLAKDFAQEISNSIFHNSKLKSSQNNARVLHETSPIVNENDTVMFSINFANNSGYILLSADKNSFPILSFSDQGSFRTENIDPASKAWIESQKKTISKNLKLPLDTANVNFKIWESFEMSYTDTNTFIIVIEDNTSSITRLNSSGQLADIMPMTMYQYQWGQGVGYNNYCPVISGQKTLVGCVALSMGIVNHYIGFTPNWPNNWNWWSINDNAIPKLPAVDNPSECARMLADFGASVNMIYGLNVSLAAGGENIVNGFKSFGYATGGQAIAYDFSRVYNSLKNNRPVILTAFDANYNGHAWVTDGYRCVTIKTVKKRPWPFKDKVTYTYKDYLSMNWGWDGQNNGYYEESNWVYYNYNRGAIVDIR